MNPVPSPLFNVTVAAAPAPSPGPGPSPSPSPPGHSKLADLAASMVPGQWAELAIPNQNVVMTDNDGGGSGSHLHYSNSMNYIPQSDRIQIVGADHGSYNGMGIFELDLAGNTFVVVSAPSVGSDAGGAGPGHGYDHASVNPHTGDAYQAIYGQDNNPPYKIRVTKRAFGAAKFATTLPKTMIDQSGNITWGSCWWSGQFQGAGAQGCLMIFNQGNSSGRPEDGVMNAFDPLTQQWFFSLVGASPNYATSGTYHALAEYSPVFNCMVYGGGNGASQKLWRMDANHSVTRLTDVPAGKRVGIQAGNLVCDPVTGKFLLLSASQLWELDPRGAGTWAQKTSPPAAVGTPEAPATDGILSCAVAPYGVVAYIKQTTASGGRFHLYKHAAPVLTMLDLGSHLELRGGRR